MHRAYIEFDDQTFDKLDAYEAIESIYLDEFLCKPKWWGN
jgi:hypothetical protein